MTAFMTYGAGRAVLVRGTVVVVERAHQLEIDGDGGD